MARPEAAALVRPVQGSLTPSTQTEAAEAGPLQPPKSASLARRSQPKSAGRYKVGTPYKVAGKLYVPASNPEYDEVGIASWYGPQFDGHATANGERFDMFSASAAHTTLPLPSIVEVTNLDNGRSIRVRINDRGPFKPGRIIDLSRGAAEELGYLQKGLARVRVRYVGPDAPDDTFGPQIVAKNRPAAADGFRLASATKRKRRSASGSPIWTDDATARLNLILSGRPADAPARKLTVALNNADQSPLW